MTHTTLPTTPDTRRMDKSISGVRSPHSPVSLLLLGAMFVFAPCAPAQEPPPQPLRMAKVIPDGVRRSATEAWGTYEIEISNFSETDRLARALFFYTGLPDVLYGRDFWVPANATVSGWTLAGPAAQQTRGTSREIEMLLYERVEGQEQLLLPRTEEKTRVRIVPYQPRAPFTAAVLDHDTLLEQEVYGQLPLYDTPAIEARTMARVVRHTAELSELVQVIESDTLPPIPEAFDGIDLFLLGSQRLARDLGGLQALRRWVAQGGRLWVMLDIVDLESVAPLLGDALDFHIVDRVGLTEFAVVDRTGTGPAARPAPVQHHDQAVQLARVVLPAEETVRHSVNGWPAWFTRTVGRGKIIFTTLGPRGWYRRRVRPPDPQSRFEHFPNLPMPTTPLEILMDELHGPRAVDPLKEEVLRPLVEEDIGYAVVGRSMALAVFGGFLVAALVVGAALRYGRRPELVGWLAPGAAVVAAGLFVVLGEQSRRSIPPTVTMAQVVDVVPGIPEASVQGVLGAYRPDSGKADLAAPHGGFFDVPMTGLEGQARRFLTEVPDSWRWENLSLPRGVRWAPFRQTLKIEAPLAARVRFGAAGLEGQITAGPFKEMGDALLTLGIGRHLGVKLRPDGAFTVGTQDALPQGGFLDGVVLSDQQQRRQDLYRVLLKPPTTPPIDPPPILYAWANPIDLGFQVVPEAQSAGAALLRMPLQWERPAPGSAVTIPGPLLSYRRVEEAGFTRPLRESRVSTDMQLRFQIPRAALPLQVTRARLLARIDAPSREILIKGRPETGKPEVVHRVASPLDALKVDILDERFLRLDADGGLHLHVTIGDPTAGDAANDVRSVNDKWTIEYLEVEVTGRALP